MELNIYMVKQPFFSVVIPTYNMGKWLPQAIESVIAQTFEDFELLIQDNASTDDTQYLVKKYTDSRISYQLNERNFGLFENANLVCSRARGKYIKFLCADDELSPVCLKTIYENLVSNSSNCHKIVSVKSTEDLDLLDLSSELSDLTSKEVNRENLFEFLAQLDNWGAGLPEFCIENDFFRTKNFWGTTNKGAAFSKDIFTWFFLVLETPVLLIDRRLVYVRPHPQQNRYIINYINQLHEVFSFFERCQKLGYNTLPHFHVGRRSYLNDYLVRHYWYGLKSLFKTRKFEYLQKIFALQKKYKYLVFPWFMVIRKALARFTR